LGPSLVGWLWPETSRTLFAPESLVLLQLVSQVGLILFMFLVGLELDPKLLRGRAHTSVAISHTSIVVPFGLGALLALHLYPRISSPSVPQLAFALFLGVAMSITAFPVLARILTERRLMTTRVGAITIACAAVDDVTAWCLLAFVVAATRASGMTGALVTTGLALAYVAVMLLAVRPLLGRVAARVANREGLTQNVVAIVLLLLLASSWATELIGIHALFGAFLFGAILPRDGGLARALAERLEDVVLVLLLPLFFAYSGVRTHIGLLDSADAWTTCGLIVLVACLGKFGGSFVAARLTGMSWRESGALGVLMNTRGLMELIVLNIGLDLGVISPTLFTMMVVMALVTTFMTTPLLQWIYPSEHFVAEAEPVAAPVTVPAEAIPSVALASRSVRRLESADSRLHPERTRDGGKFAMLVCVAKEESGPGLVTLAHALSDPRAPADVIALHLLQPPDRVSIRLPRGEDDAGLQPLLARAEELALDVTPTSFVSVDPAEDICEVAKNREADLVLLGWHRPVVSQTVLGGVVYQVMTHASADVAVFVDRGFERARRILVPFVGTAHDRAALALARRLQLFSGAEVTLLHVRKPEGTRDDESGAHVFDEPEGGRVRVRMVHHVSPVEVALAESREGYDLVIVGAGREWGLEQRRLGVQPERLIRESPASLLVVRGRVAPASERVAGRAPATA
ncbi:MAG: cation:proton antiporter, partial [Deltaproteobacteria bacterium]|nr:cation:proton antiporter [Deltaproteobacteria bacterium]